jgi:hypothetical protein
MAYVLDRYLGGSESLAGNGMVLLGSSTEDEGTMGRVVEEDEDAVFLLVRFEGIFRATGVAYCKRVAFLVKCW